MPTIETVIVLCGIGTFLLRLLPIWRSRTRSGNGTDQTDQDGWLQRFFRGIGPAAITALLLVSFWPFLTADHRASSLPAAAAALLTIFLLKRLTRGLAGPTLCGAAVYGLLMHLLS